MELLDLADGVLLAEYPGASDADANRAAVGLAAALAALELPGFHDAVPGARTLCVLFDSRLLSLDALRNEILSRGAEPAPPAAGRSLSIPVVYGGADGPDLPGLAASLGLSAEEVARRHAAATYEVAFLGFAPGFAYLSGLPPELHAERLPTPRPRVPEGSVAIGGPYTGVYPAAMPGGWRLIGRSPARLIDEDADPPALFGPGDRVRFEPIGAAEFEARRRELASLFGRADTAPSGLPLLRIVRPGLFTSVQGAPRWGNGASGFSPGGAMDETALARGNRILGSAPDAGALEITLLGPEVEVLRDVGVCVSGAPIDLEHNGVSASPETPLRCRAGDRVRLGPVRRDSRAYLCVEGGLAPPGRLGLTRRIEAGALVIGEPPGPTSPAPPEAGAPDRSAGGDLLLGVLPDPREPVFFEPAALETLLASEYRVSSTSDRRGVRLEGPPLACRTPGIPPEGTALGTIQVPRDGLPIVLGPDRPVTGGYAKLGTLLAADWPRLAQAEPGRRVRFERRAREGRG